MVSMCSSHSEGGIFRTAFIFEAGGRLDSEFARYEVEVTP